MNDDTNYPPALNHGQKRGGMKNKPKPYIPKALPMPPWKTAPISATCETIRKGGVCALPTERAYQSHGGGWMALCLKHGMKHSDYAPHIEELIRKGETFA